VKKLIFFFKQYLFTEVPKSLMKKSKEDKQTLAELSSASKMLVNYKPVT